MATLYARKDSPFWYARIWDAQKAGWLSVKTPARQDDPAGKRNALQWATAKEQVEKADRPLLKAESWGVWVVPWLQRNFEYNKRTLKRYEEAWSAVHSFLDEHQIPTPRHWKYADAGRYMDWRKQQRRRRGTFINHNTALTELKIFSRIMQEAVRRDFCSGNPLFRLGIRRQNVKHTARMTEDEIALIRRELATRPSWMSRCFEIALHHGCRLSETQVPLERVWLDPRTTPGAIFDRITFHCKGRNGEKKVLTVPLNPALRPLMQQLKAAKEKSTCVLPRMAAKEWWKFRQKVGVPHLRFHSTRATVASLLAEQGVPQQVAMEILAHASETVHRAYLTLDARPVGDAVRKIAYGPDAGLSRPGIPDAPIARQ